MATNLPPEFLAQQQELTRQQRMAELLMGQGMQQPQGQMVSGRYVAPSFFQNLTPLVNAYVGSKMSEKADQRQLDLAKAVRNQYANEIKEFRRIQQGQEAVPERNTEMAGPFGEGVGPKNADIPMPVATMPARAAVPPNPQGAYDYAATASNPALQSVGMKQLTPQEVILSEGQERFLTNPDGTLKAAGSGREKQSPEYQNYLRAQNDPIEPFKGGFTAYQTMLKKAGASNINLPSESERKAGFMANILDKNILQMQTALGIDPSAVKPNVPASVVTAIAGENVLSRAITPTQRQIIEDSQLDVLDAALTLRTGAAYTREQLLGMRGTYFPRLGDNAQTIKAKQARLETLLSSAYIASGRATPNRVSEIRGSEDTPPAGGGKLPPPPKGVDAKLWGAMTPQERALWK